MNEPLLAGMAQTALDRTDPLLRPGNTNCGGCGMSSTLQMLSRAVAQRPVQIVIPAACAAVAAAPFPFSGFGAPVLMATFAAAAAAATGLAQVARLNGRDTRVICWTGDGGTYDIGLATISAAAERNEDILLICYDNEIYGNTGGQRSSATPVGARTTNTIRGKLEGKKDILGIMAAHGIPYAASVSLAHPDDALRKMRHALDLRGFRFLHVLAPCPTGWKSEPALGMELIRLAVRAGLYPVCEITNGSRWHISIEPDLSAEALELYLSMQRRFHNTDLSADRLLPEIEEHWAELRARCVANGKSGTQRRVAV